MEDEGQDKIISFLRSNLVIISLLGIGVLLIVVGLFQIMGGEKATVTFEKGQGVANAQSSTTIKVDVEGEVIKPGVYELEGDPRVQDALIAAGGLTQNANRKALNLAQKVVDGQKVYVSAVGEVSVMGVNSEPSNGSLSINSASLSELEKLPGIGPVSGQKIIDNRPYGSVEELLSKKAVGKATYEKIKDQITL